MSMARAMATVLLVGGGVAAVAAGEVGFGGAAPLGPRDTLRQALKPYDLVKLNVLGAAYCENLLDCRVNTTSYSQLNYDSPVGDGYNLQFPDDAARFLECLAWEDQFSPVVRLELARRLVKGLLAARVPGTFCESFFRHRSGGKTFLIFGDRQAPAGRMLLSMWGDELSGALKVGFRLRRGDQWLGIEGFGHSDPPDGVVDAGAARSDRYWHASPVTVRRAFATEGAKVDFVGRYWLSDENRPLEYAFVAGAGDGLQVVIGEPGCPLPVLGDYRLPTTLHLPDRQTTYRSDRDGDRVFERPGFRYLILRKAGGAWATTGYSAALLVAWEGAPERVEAIADKGYGEVRVQYAGRCGRVWLNPYYWLDERDLESVHRSAESFLEHGVLLQNGFPTQQLWNEIPAGMGAGAYLLTRYRDPLAVTARVNAARVVDRLFAAEDEGKTLVRAFFPVKAAAWMLKTARELGDRELEARYAARLDHAVTRMCSAGLGYDGTGWAGGWDHFNSTKALWLAWDAAGNPAYREAFERAMTVYSIDAQGIYRNGKKVEAPGGFDTYSGSLPLAVWGLAGKLDWVEQLIGLQVPGGWHEPQRLVCDTWNDAGAGPWAQDDANPEVLGLSLRGAQLSTSPKYVVPVGAFPSYDRAGAVTPANAGLLHNPFFLAGSGAACTVDDASAWRPARVRTLEVRPGAWAERRRSVRLTGRAAEGVRVCTGADEPLVYRFFGLGRVAGAGLDLRLRGDGYRVSVSPDGERWLERLDTDDPVPADQSLDLSFLTGSSEELVRLLGLTPPTDDAYVVTDGSTVAADKQRRFVPAGGALVYRLPVADVVVCRLEILAGNGYRLECSGDGERWEGPLTALDADGGGGRLPPDAAMLRMLDATPCLGRRGELFLRIADGGDATAFGGRPAFVQRVAVYGSLRSGQAWVRIENVSARPEASFALERLALRTW